MLEINTSPNKFLPKNNKRLSKVPIIILFTIAVIVLFSVFYVALSRKQNLEKQATQTAPKEETQSTSKIENIASYVDELSQTKQIKEQNSTLQPVNNTIPITQQVQQEIKPQPIQTPILMQNNEIDERELRLKKDMQLKALISQTSLGIKSEIQEKPTIGNHFTPSQTDYPNIPNDQVNTSAGLGGLDTNANKDAQGQQFLSQKNDNGYLKNSKQKPLSPYEIKAGWNIPAVLITGVNSDLPGQILAQVTQNVYDTSTGKYLLIPQGTKVVGAYSSNIIYGQSRLLVAWNKLIFPNGDTLNIDSMQGTSQDGYTGFEDEVDNHYFRIFGSAFLLSSITAGIALSDNSSTNGEKETASDKAISQAIQQMGQVASEMIRKNMNVSPTLKIRPGYKFNIFVTKDIILEPLELR
ncbi:conjugal transfer protein TrbI [Campylobacter jejuni]|uniref:TrbI/VirB10 family protein n=1 Tax=Campylobacter TaxID=194 RepID=UPI000874DC1B|nr:MULTISPECIES: TrbI/VirB10 family protein [Campylobacter]OEW14395.1 conjugal transfer protein TrbI [Campylobacter sp. BCW_6876]EAI5152941.1 conjugal transfer protein TrbI [Campylobacter jejuni]EAJ2085177.1 conjugal transfer protein TrbI [Campylobacter jejuni]EAJ8464678.1 conjugal transfer protein TrbI [Campylobacter jejuni]EAJ9542986.1 conjugal transfer protein TrbI [Campylobacter jejuni]